MVKIRLTRVGKKNDLMYRIVAIEHTNRNQGEALEILGRWNPRENTKEVDKKAIEAWVARGAQVSPAVEKLMNEK